MFNLKGKKALITGASKGIGAEIARIFVAAGAEVIITGSNEENLKKIASELQPNARFVVCNLLNKQEVENLAASEVGEIDILVCNAGITRDGLIVRMKDSDWDEVLQVNLTAHFKLMRAAVKGMMKRRFGRIINIASVVASSGNPGQANYCATKAGLIGMTKSIALEIASRGITANSISPGFIKTDMTEKLTEEQAKKITENIPCKFMGTARDVAAAALYLASDEAGYITGQNLHLNGGLYLA